MTDIDKCTNFLYKIVAKNAHLSVFRLGHRVNATSHGEGFNTLFNNCKFQYIYQRYTFFYQKEINIATLSRYIYTLVLIDGIIFYNDKKNKLPGKELSVLILLLNSAGLLLSANEIIKKIWRGDLGAEKSLARCIYVLRKILQENKDNRYIDVVYGKGYRFIRPVTRLLPENKKKSKSMLAILPFKMENQVDSLIIHDFLLQALSKYTPLGLSILPSILTNNCKNYDDIVTLLDKTQPDYYLAGTMIICNSQPCLRIELVHAGEHSIVHRESIILEKDINFSCFILQHILDEFLPNHIPCLQNKKINHQKYNIKNRLLWKGNFIIILLR